jgi:hypothetical protein
VVAAAYLPAQLFLVLQYRTQLLLVLVEQAAAQIKMEL